MEILLCAKALRADIYSQFVSALRTAAGCVKRRSRGAGPMCPAAEHRICPGGARGPRPTGCGGHTGRTESSAPTRFVRDVVPQGHLFRCAPLQDAVPYAPCHCAPVRAAKQVPLGYRLARQSVFPALVPLDKPVGMGIIVSVRGRCDKRSAPLSENFNEPYGSQKPSPCRVAVFAFQSLDSYRDRMTQNMNRKHEKHTVTPLQKEVTDRLAMYTASLGCIISRLPVFVNSHRLTNPAGWI